MLVEKRSITIGLLLVIIFSLLGPSHFLRVRAETQGIPGSPTVQHTAFFGQSVAVSAHGRSILVGATDAMVLDRFGQFVPSGEVYLFDAQGTLVHVFRNPNPEYYDLFGASVAISPDGNTVLIGAPRAGPSGFAFLFHREGDLIRKYGSPNPTILQGFGGSVAILARQPNDEPPSLLILVASPFASVTTASSGLPIRSAGQAFLFDTLGNLVRTYTDPNPTSDENFGLSLSASYQEMVLIGAPNANIVTSTGSILNNAGKAFLFDTRGGPAWTYEDPNATSLEQFGWSVAMSEPDSGIDNTNNNDNNDNNSDDSRLEVFVGAPSARSPGLPGHAVFGGGVFLFTASRTLIRVYQDPVSDCYQFGGSIAASMTDDSLLVGSSLGSCNPQRAYQYGHGGILATTFQDPHPLPGERFGFSVSMSSDGSRNVIGALFRGHAFLFDSSGDLLLTL